MGSLSLHTFHIMKAKKRKNIMSYKKKYVPCQTLYAFSICIKIDLLFKFFQIIDAIFLYRYIRIIHISVAILK